MAKIIARNVGVLGRARDVSGRSNSAALKITAEAPEVTSFGAVNRERLSGGIKDTELSFKGFYDQSASNVDELYSDLISASTYWGVYPRGCTATYTGYEFNGILTDYSPDSSVDGAVTTSMTVTGCGGVFRTTVIASSTVSGAATGSGVGVDTGASQTGPTYFFRLFTAAGASCVMTASWASASELAGPYVTLAQITASLSQVEYVTTASVTGASRYQRVAYTLTGTSPCVTYMLSSGNTI